MTKLLRALIVEDSEDDVQLILRQLRSGGYDPKWERVETAEAMSSALAREQWDVILCDYRLPRFNAPAALKLLQEKQFDIPFIIVSGTIGEEAAVAAMKDGAHDYIMKDKLAKLVVTMEREIREAGVRREHRRMEEDLRRSEERFRALIESSSDVVTIIDANGTVLYQSPNYINVWGRGSSGEIGKDMFKDVHPDDIPIVGDSFARLLKDAAEPVHIQVRALHTDGSWRILDVVAYNYLQNPAVCGIVVTLRDITERKRAEDALRESEEKYRTLVEQSLLGILIVQDGRVVYMNNIMSERGGYSLDELASLSQEQLKGLIHPDDRDAVWTRMLSRLNGNPEPVRSECRFIAKDGSVYWVDYHVNIIEYLGRPAIQMFIVDITERKTREQEYQIILETAIDGFWQADMKGRFLDVNEAYCHLIGYSRDELLNMSISDVEVTEKAEDISKRIRKIKEVGYDHFESRHRCKDGKIIDVEISVNYLTTAGGRMFVFIRNITERKQAEITLRDSEEKFRTAFDNANTGMCLVDLNGNLMKVNEKMSEIFGYSKEELERMTVNDIAYPEDRDLSPQFMKKAVNGEVESSIFEKRYYSKKGTIVWGQVSSALVRDANGKPFYFISQVQDITARKVAEEGLRQSEERFRMIVSTSQEWIWVTDSKGHHTYSNPAVENILGYKPGEVIGHSAFELLHEDDIPLVRQILARAINEKAGWSNIVLRWKRKDGEYRYLETNAVPLINSSGVLQGFQGSDRDITERKRAEEKLKETRDYVENLIEHANVPMVVWTPDFRITRFNRAFERLTGMNAKTVIGKDLEILFPKDARERSMSYIRAAIKGARWEVVEIPILSVQGGIKNVLWNISPVYAESGKAPIAIIAQGQDITRRKQVEEALEESEEMSRSMLDNAPMGVYLLQEKKFLYVNPTFEKVVGYSSADLVGREAINYVHPNDRGIVRTKAVENIKGISVLPYEFRVLRKDGKQIWVMERVTPIKYKGRRAVIASFMETTEHRKAEVELERAYEELKTAHERMVQSEKLRAMGEMASGIAHDFNNMLAVILGRTQLIEEDVRDDKVKKGIQIIEQAALDAAKTVKRLQDFARIRVEHPFEPLNVNEVIEGVLKMVESRRVELEQTKGIAIKVEQRLGEVGHVSGDAAELREALLNILFNALDAMPTGGKLTVKSEQDENWVQMLIQDTGVGIPDKLKSKIFQPFFTTKSSKGSGLGLSVTYGIIARHGGMVRFDSKVGKGTTFFIRLPLAVEAKKKKKKMGKVAAARPVNILAVDDEPEVLKALDLTLEYFGHWVKGVTSGAEAIKAFKDGNYDLVITDLGMPEVSGWDVARAVKKMKPEVPVLLITGWVIDLDKEQKGLVDGVISKPFSRDSISSAISAVFPAKKKRAVKKKSSGKKKSE